ncbi:hypothetical protein EHYA_03717 [Embleya hyalina]|uniref:Uncharacterized protein n=1 Tax=Embleya hyalina TaxID=516124 RepID=A0A401YN46_9ACTN|nr:hypothetical protein EHYA_03717 [Embleya hyalina]
MSTWTAVSNLSVTLQNGDRSCDIYANGRNRIGVTIAVEPIDENAQPIRIDPEHLLANLWLVDYADESKLPWKSYASWSYTDVANEFTATPGASSGHTKASTDDDGTQRVTLYVYCSPEADPKSIGVQVRTDSGDVVKSSLNGMYHGKVTLTPRAPLSHGREDIDWDCSRTPTANGDTAGNVTTQAWNYYLSLKADENDFVSFSASRCYTDAGYDGFFAYDITPDGGRDNFYGAYVWFREPHDSAYYSPQDGHSRGQIVNFPAVNAWCDYATIYDREHPERYLCFTWVHSTAGGGWHIPNGPMPVWREYWPMKIVANDKYGNTGTFWVDGSDVTDALDIYDREP